MSQAKDADGNPARRPRRRKATIVVDELKARHTSHWDLDLLPRAELDRAWREGRAQLRRYRLRQMAWILGILTVLCLYPTLWYHLQRLWH